MAEGESMIIRFFGDYPFVRVLAFLLEYDIFDFSRKEVCEHADVSWNTLMTFWNRLEKEKVVIPTRKIGKTQLFRLNKENPIVIALLEFQKRLMVKVIDEMKIEHAVPVKIGT